jgi:hypothetical protein
MVNRIDGTGLVGFRPDCLGEGPSEATEGNHLLGGILIVHGRVQVGFLPADRGVHSVTLGSRALWQVFTLVVISLVGLIEEVGRTEHSHFLQTFLVDVLQLGRRVGRLLFHL